MPGGAASRVPGRRRAVSARHAVDPWRDTVWRWPGSAEEGGSASWRSIPRLRASTGVAERTLGCAAMRAPLTMLAPPAPGRRSRCRRGALGTGPASPRGDRRRRRDAQFALPSVSAPFELRAPAAPLRWLMRGPVRSEALIGEDRRYADDPPPHRRPEHPDRRGARLLR